jgi:hypothetical protein
VGMFKAKVAIMETMHVMPTAPPPPIPVAAPEPVYAEPEPVRAAPVPVPDASVEAMPVMSDSLRRQYIALAAELGVTQPGLQRDAARAYFAGRGIRLYMGDKVKAYLDDQYGKEKQVEDPRFAQGNGRRVFRGHPTWCWRPLRGKDKTVRPEVEQGWAYSTPETNDSIWPEATPYDKPLPLPVLLTVKEVSAEFPTARFYVSDEVHSYEHRDPVLDPFLLVVVETERFIIERWDEPGYRE